jgi:hypothetical protein
LPVPLTAKEASELLGEQAADREVSETVHARLSYFFLGRFFEKGICRSLFDYIYE